MSKHRTLTPAEEAQRAIDSGFKWQDLDEAALTEYDRLLEEGRYPPRNPPPDSPAALGPQIVLQDAQRAMQLGWPVFLARIPQGWERMDLGTSGLPTPSVLLAQIEAMGWQLDRMSWVSRNDWMRAQGFFLFRRGNPGDRLAEVTRLRDEGLLTEEEYQAKRAEIISQI